MQKTGEIITEIWEAPCSICGVIGEFRFAGRINAARARIGAVSHFGWHLAQNGTDLICHQCMHSGTQMTMFRQNDPS